VDDFVIDYKARTNGRFTGILRWPQFETLWQALASDTAGWYVYAPEEAGVPTQPLSREEMADFLVTTERYLRELCTKDRCGTVYTDSLTEPEFVKVYNPRLMGGCGVGKAPLPQWLISRISPESLVE